MKNEEIKKYVIRYKFNTEWGLRQWNYSISIANNGTCSVIEIDNRSITKMILTEAKKNVVKIKEIRKKRKQEITEIQIINIKTNEIIDITQKYTKFTRFEIMDI